MKIFTSHFRADTLPVLVPEGFSVWAALFGWVWFLVHRAWLPAAFALAASLLVARAAHLLGSAAPVIGFLVLQGLVARDLQRWSLGRRGYIDGPVVGGADQDGALSRLLDTRPDLTAAA